MSASGHWHSVWGTPILTAQLPDNATYLNRLKSLILAEQENSPGQGAGVVEAEKTRSDLLKWNDPLINPLRGWIADVADAMNAWTGVGVEDGHQLEMIAEAWAVTYHISGFHRMHTHPGSIWSGVLYVDVGNIEEGYGLIEFLDPRAAAAAANVQSEPLYRIAPETGMLLAFPSWLQHWVTPYGSTDHDDVRVCVAFNIGFTEGSSL